MSDEESVSPVRISQSAIAKALGVARSTVSRALRHSPEISKARAEEIRQTAKDLGYVPDPALAALAAYSSVNRPQLRYQ